MIPLIDFDSIMLYIVSVHRGLAEIYKTFMQVLL